MLRHLPQRLRAWWCGLRWTMRPLAARNPRAPEGPGPTRPSFHATQAAAASGAPTSAFERALAAVDAPGLRPVERLRRLAALEGDLTARGDLSPIERTAAETALREARNRHEPLPEQLRQDLRALMAGLDLNLLATQVPAARVQIDDMAQVLALATRPTAAERAALGQALEASRSDLQRLEHRGSALTALHSEAPALRASLAALPPSRYCTAQRSLDRLLEVLKDTPRDLVLHRLNAMVISPEATQWLELAARGDAGIIDMVFKGADWDDDALALKLAAIDPQDEAAQRRIDVQHNLRMVSQELNSLMAARNQQSGRRQMPVSLFQAVRADEAVIRWLTRSAGSWTRERAAQIGAWISLSLYDEATGTVNQEDVDKLLRQLEAAGTDVAGLQPYIRLGFNSTAEVVEARELMQKVARACQENLLLESLDEVRFPALAAGRQACRLIREVTGRETETPSGPEVDEALATALEQAMPWIRFEEDLARARVQLTDELQALQTPPAGFGDRARSERQWLADPAELDKAARDHDRVRDVLFVDEKLTRAVQEGARPQAVADLRAQREALLRELSGFSADALRRSPRANRPPTIESLRAIAAQMQTLARLPSLHHKVAILTRLSTPTPAQAEQAQGLLARLRQIATLQVALASADPNFRPNGLAASREGYTGQIVKRLDAMGLSVKRPSPYLRRAVDEMVKALTQDGRSLVKVHEDAAAVPLAQSASETVGRLWSALRGRAATGETGRPAVDGPEGASPAITLTEGERRQRAALAAIDREVRALVPGAVVSIQMGAYGGVSVSTPVVPGVSASSSLRLKVQHGLQVALQKDGSYLLTVHTGGSVRHGVALQALEEVIELEGYLQGGVEAGIALRYDDRESCLAATERLVLGREMGPALLSASQAQRVTGWATEGGLQLSVQADLSVASLSAEVAGQMGYSTQVTRSVAGEVETQTRTLAARAAGSATTVSGAGRSALVGVQLEARKTLHRQYGILRPDSRLSLSATVVGGNAERCLESLLPGLTQEQRRALQSRVGESVPDGTQLYVRYRLTPEARRRANAQLGEAARALMAASLSTDGRSTQRIDKAREHARAAHLITRAPDSYEPEGWGWVAREDHEVTRKGLVHERFAQGTALKDHFETFAPGTQGITLGEAPAALQALIP